VIVVIGGDVVGVCPAYLARRGLPVTLVEKGEIAARPSRDLLQWLLRFCRACTADQCGGASRSSAS
jgi:glycine/D-amino acid oxidase-like deaminating enzyme